MQKMKKTFLMLTAVLFAASLAAQNKITVDKLNPFRQLQVNGKIELFITLDTDRPTGMSIDMNGSDANQLKWWEEEGALQIKFSPRSKAEPVIIRLNAHTLESIDIQRASVTFETPWTQFMTTVNLAMSAKLTAEIHSTDIKVSTQTSAVAVLKGSADFADFDAHTKSKLDARDFNATNATMKAGIYAEGYVYGTQRLIIDALDGASVFYRGKPEIMRQRSVRGGHINSIGE